MAARSVPQLIADLKQGLTGRARATVNDAAAGLIAANAPMGAQWRTIAEVLIHNGEVTLARQAAQQLLKASTGADAQLYVASVFARTGMQQEALARVERVARTLPNSVGLAFTKGTLQLNLGDLDAARATLRDGLTQQSTSGQTWLALAMAGGLGHDDPWYARLRDTESRMDAAPALERAQYHYARGKAEEERGAVDDAFAAYQRGAQLARPLFSYQRGEDQASAHEAVAGYGASEGQRASSSPPTRAIIVTGSPRSGTTLVEHILTSHSAVEGGDELGRFGLIAAEVGGYSADALSRWCGRGHATGSLAALYGHIIDERFPGAGLIVDKTPDASRYLALLTTIIPGAPILWLRRDPLDRAWSCFRNYFLRGVPWSYDLEDIAHHFRLEDKLLAALRPIIGERLLEVDYETLVRQPGTVIPAIVAHCGLAMEPQVLEPHRQKRVVTTASVTQVRAPINTRAIGGAEAYRHHLAPFIRAYAG